MSTMVHNHTTATAAVMGGTGERRRPKIAAMESGPGPGKYLLPGTCGNGHGPTYSFGTRTKQSSSMHVAKNSPGPIYYVNPSFTRTGRTETPIYSLYSRPKTLEKQQSPGPAAYDVRAQGRKLHAPVYSMGKRLVYSGSRGKSPAPNVYTLPTLVGATTPAYSLSGRPKTGGFADDTKKTPGPGTYQIAERATSPSFSLLGRNFPPSGKRQSPGPAEYSPEKVTISQRVHPAFSFGVKHSEYIASYLETAV